MDEEPLLTIQEVATKLKVTTKTVRQWLQREQLRGIKAGKLWRVPESAVDEFLKKPTKGKEGSKS